jgi:hypothetical protein
VDLHSTVLFIWPALLQQALLRQEKAKGKKKTV